jgi:hypothetical protein
MHKFLKVGVAGLVAASALALTPMALAASSAPKAATAVVTTGSCSGSSTWMLTLKLDNGRIESDIDVQTNAAGQLWKFTMKDNGVKFAGGKKTTVADGSWSATRFATNLTGPDHITVNAKNTVTGETCAASGTF